MTPAAALIVGMTDDQTLRIVELLATCEPGEAISVHAIDCPGATHQCTCVPLALRHGATA